MRLRGCRHETSSAGAVVLDALTQLFEAHGSEPARPVRQAAMPATTPATRPTGTATSP